MQTLLLAAGHGPAADAPAAYLPLFMAIPLLAAGIAAMVPGKIVRNALMFAVPSVGLIGGVWLLIYHLHHGAAAVNVGSFAGGVAIPFASDEFSALMITATSIVALTAIWFGAVVGETAARFFPALVLMLLAGVYGALLTADLFNLFVCIEVMLLPSYALLAMTGALQRLRAGRVFILVNLVTSTFLVVGVGLIYATAGTTNLGALAGAADGHGPVVVAGGVVLIALAIKAGLVPVHTWLPRTYPMTSPTVMALFSGLHTKVAFYGIFRVYTVVFGLDSRFSWLIAIVCVVAMIVGSWAGIGERSMRGVLAYQMVNGMPFILVVLALDENDPQRLLAAGIFYAIHHMMTVGSLSLSIGAVEETYGTGRLRRLSGLMRRDPLAAALFVCGALSIVGLPPFSGVIAKLGLVTAVASVGTTEAYIVLAAIVIAGLGALIAMVRLWREVYWGKPMNPQFVDRSLAIRGRFLVPSFVMMLCSLGLLVGAGPMIDVTNEAADALLDVQSYSASILGDEPVGVAPQGGAGLNDAGPDPAPIPDELIVEGEH